MFIPLFPEEGHPQSFLFLFFFFGSLIVDDLHFRSGNQLAVVLSCPFHAAFENQRQEHTRIGSSFARIRVLRWNQKFLLSR